MLNNPLRYTDPSGHGAPEDLWAWIRNIIRVLANPRQAAGNACALTLDSNCGRTISPPSVSGLLEAGNRYAQEKTRVNFGPPAINPEVQKAIAQAAELGQWIVENTDMSDRSLVYQGYVTGHPGEAFEYNGVKFDAITDNALIEAKGYYRDFVDPKTGDFYNWYRESASGGKGLVSQAKRQLEAAEGAPIEWHFNEKDVMELVSQLFKDEGIQGIELVYDPFPLGRDQW